MLGQRRHAGKTHPGQGWEVLGATAADKGFAGWIRTGHDYSTERFAASSARLKNGARSSIGLETILPSGKDSEARWGALTTLGSRMTSHSVVPG